MSPNDDGKCFASFIPHHNPILGGLQMNTSCVTLGSQVLPSLTLSIRSGRELFTKCDQTTIRWTALVVLHYRWLDWCFARSLVPRALFSATIRVRLYFPPTFLLSGHFSSIVFFTPSSPWVHRAIKKQFQSLEKLSQAALAKVRNGSKSYENCTRKG